MNTFHPHSLARRARQSAFLVYAVFGVLLTAFFNVQILSSSRYRLRSDNNRLRTVYLPAPRGLIVDVNGIVLAENVPSYTVSLIASSEEGLRELLDQVSMITAIDSATVADATARWLRSSTDPVVVFRDAPIEVVARLEERRVVLPGLVVQTEPKRSYPFGELAAHVIGYVGEISEQELRGRTFPGARFGTLVGRVGVEQQYDERLRGSDGARFVEVDALGRTVRTDGMGGRIEPVQGDTIRTTLDIRLQEYIAEIFPSGSRGAVIVMDPRDGAVLAMYSAPSYDPNIFVGREAADERARLLSDEEQPLFNRAIQGRYPPASPWKLAVAVMALRRGLISLDTKMPTPCTGGFQYGNRFFRCWKRNGHGYLTLAEAIERSCDVYFYQLGLRVTLPALLEDGTEMGFGELAGIDIPGETRSIFPRSPGYYDERYGPSGWTNAVTLNLAIGQGENDQTLINMMRFYSMLANPGGSADAPYLVERNQGDGRSIKLPGEASDGLREALIEVVQSGTAAGARIANLRIAGKTGTAQNAQGEDHGWFIAFAPADNPVVVAGIIVEFAEHGSRVAPLVNNVIARHLLGDDYQEGAYQVELPADSAPASVPIIPVPRERPN